MIEKIFSRVTWGHGRSGEFAHTSQADRGRHPTSHKRGGEWLEKEFTGIGGTGLVSVTSRLSGLKRLMACIPLETSTVMVGMKLNPRLKKLK